MLALEHLEGIGPTVIFLPGYASDMGGTKALALAAWAKAAGRAFVRFDYRGCGESADRFEDFTLEDWRDDVLGVVDAVVGRVVLVGSSMGGWLMLLAALARPARPEKIVGLVGVAAAPDFTDWGFDPARRAALARDGPIVAASDYGDSLVTTLDFWQAGQRNLLLGAPIEIVCPVRLLHGQRDPDVPWENALRLAEQLQSDDVQVTLIKDGDHRLSRPQDTLLLIAAVEALVHSNTR